LAAGLVGERVEDGERGGPQAQGEPRQRGRLLVRERQTLTQEVGDLLFLSGFGFETDEQSECHEHLLRSRGLGMRPSHLDQQIRRRPGPGAIDKNAIFDTVLAMRILVLALDSVFDTGLSTVLDAFQTANELAALSGVSASRFDVSVVGVRKHVKTAQGLTVPVGAAGKRPPDCVVVPAIGFKMPDTLQRALVRPDIRDAAAMLRQWAARGATMTAACVGTFILAESGLLDDRDATTTWWL